jgi:hypothetical protein
MKKYIFRSARSLETLVTCMFVLLAAPIALSEQAATAGSGGEGVRIKIQALVPPELVSGQNYTLAPEALVHSGVALYRLDTEYGNTEVAGTVRLTESIAEIQAIEALKEMQKTDVYKKALKKSAGGPLDTAKKLASDPVDTVSKTARGLGNFLADVGYSIVSDDPSQENVAKTVIGFGAAKRQLAYELGVNPYSSFEPLQEHLSDVAWAATGGGMTITAAFSTITSTAGRVVRITAGSNTARKMVRDKSPRDLKNHNMETLEKMGVNKDLAETLVENYNYNPEAITRLISALDSMHGVEGRSSIAARAATASTRHQASNMRDWLELMAAYHAIVAPARRLVIVSTAPFIVDAQGVAHGVFPTDYVSSEPGFAKLIEATSEQIRALGLKTGALYATGKIDPGMVEVMQAAGWTEVHDHAERILRTE